MTVIWVRQSRNRRQTCKRTQGGTKPREPKQPPKSVAHPAPQAAAKACRPVPPVCLCQTQGEAAGEGPQRPSFRGGPFLKNPRKDRATVQETLQPSSRLDLRSYLQSFRSRLYQLLPQSTPMRGAPLAATGCNISRCSSFPKFLLHSSFWRSLVQERLWFPGTLLAGQRERERAQGVSGVQIRPHPAAFRIS